MTFKSLFLLLTAFVIAMAFIASCEEKCGFCPDGSECIDGSCHCKPGYFSFNNHCISPDSNEYVGITPSCHCYDTLVVTITGSEGSGTLGMAFKAGPGVLGKLRTSIEYYNLPDGDSIWGPEAGYKCVLDTVPTYPTIYGKKQADGSWKLFLEFRDAYAYLNIKDTCTIIARPL